MCWVGAGGLPRGAVRLCWAHALCWVLWQEWGGRRHLLIMVQTGARLSKSHKARSCAHPGDGVLAASVGTGLGWMQEPDVARGADSKHPIQDVVYSSSSCKQLELFAAISLLSLM